MKNFSKKEFQNRLNNADWNLEIATRVMKKRKQRRNLSMAVIVTVLIFGISVMGVYQNSKNSSLAFSANDHFESIFTQDFNLQNISYILEE